MRGLRRGRTLAGLLGVAVATGWAGLAPAADWDAGAGEKWQALLAAARQEGPLVAGICTEIGDQMAKDFKADTGLDIALVPGSIQDVNNRYRTEIKSGRVSIDLHAGGPSDLDLARAGSLMDLTDKLILPSVTDPKRWAGGALSWIDNDKKYIPLTAEYVSTRPLINKDIIDPASIKTWDDLLKPEFKGKISFFDPTVSGEGQTFGAYLAKIKGIEFIEKLFKQQEAVPTRDSRQMGEWAARGLYPIGLGINALYLDRFQREGITSLAFVSPQDGPGSLVGGCAGINIAKGAPHPNAAVVFVNWFMSPAGQRSLEKAGRYPSRRTDIPHDGINPYYLPDPKIDYLNQYKEDWYINELTPIRSALREKLKAYFGN